LPNEADLFQARLGGVSVLGQDRQTGSKAVNLLIQDAQRRPFDGLGKPEPLRHQLAGFWSRRISGEHRFVYPVEGDDLLIAQLRFHYNDV